MKPNLSYQVFPSYDSRVLIIADTSTWAHLIEEPTYIDITLPGSKTAKTLPYQKEKVNVFNSSNLGYGCEALCEDDLISLPDGIYCLKVYVCEGNKFFLENHYLRTVNLELKLNKLLVDVGLGCNPNTNCVNQIIEAEMLLKGAKADILFGNLQDAGKKYEQAFEIVEDLENCDCSKIKGNNNGYSSTIY